MNKETTSHDKESTIKKPIPLGMPGAPWPTLIRTQKQVGADMVQTFELGVMEDPEHPMAIHSNRSYAEVAGKFYRDMPVPSMLPALEFVVARAHPEQLNRVANLISDPGTGKSYLAVLVGTARDKRGPLITDAGGKNLEYLLFETVFKLDESRSLTKAIDEGLRENKLDQLSLEALKRFGTHFSEENGRKCIDWRGLAEDKSIGTDKIREVLELVRTVERWDANKMTIGFEIKKGPLVLAHEEGRDLVIDELNKAKPGSETPLQIVWQVLNGEIESHTVKLGGSGEFTFNRGQGGFVVCTGNLPKDGIGTHLISESFDRRVPGFRIPNFDTQDWQHRICQKMTGLPISTLHRMQKGKWETVGGKQTWVIDDPEAFTKLLVKFRTLGLSLEEKRNVPDWQINMLTHWKSVLQATEKLADFYSNWTQLVDPDSRVLKSGSMPEVLAEIENSANPTSKITPSTMIRHIEEATHLKPKVKEVGKSHGFDASYDWETAPNVHRLEREAIETKFGTRLASIIMEEVYRTTRESDKPNLFKQVEQLATNAGLIGNAASTPTLLNITAAQKRSISDEARQTQRIIVDFLRREHPEITANDDDIISPHQIEQTITRIASEHSQPGQASPYTNLLYIPNPDIGNVQSAPVRAAFADNRDADESLEELRKRLPVEALVSKEGILAALALPATGAMALKSLWNQCFTNGAQPSEEPTAMAQNQSKSGLAITTLLCRKNSDHGNSYTKLHVLHNERQKKTLIIGEGDISPELRNQIRKRGISYIDQEDSHVESLVYAALHSMISPTQQGAFRSAFLLRNAINAGVNPETSLATLLSHGDQTSLVIPNCITSLTPEQILHSKRIGSGPSTERS